MALPFSLHEYNSKTNWDLSSSYKEKKDVTFSRKSNQKAFLLGFASKLCANCVNKLTLMIFLGILTGASKNLNLLLYMIDTIKAKWLYSLVANRGFFVHCTKTTMCRARRSEALDLREI